MGALGRSAVNSMQRRHTHHNLLSDNKKRYMCCTQRRVDEYLPRVRHLRAVHLPRAATMTVNLVASRREGGCTTFTAHCYYDR